MNAEQTIGLVEETFRPSEVRKPIVHALEGAYAAAFGAAPEYGPWLAARWGVPHHRRALVNGELSRVAVEIPNAKVVLINTIQRSYTYLGLQIGQVLALPARTEAPNTLPRRADIRCKLAESPQMSLPGLEFFGIEPKSDLLMVVIGHGPSEDPSSLGWARVLIPDRFYLRPIHSIDLVASEINQDNHPENVSASRPVPIRLRENLLTDEIAQ